MSIKRTIGLLSVLALLQRPVVAKEQKPEYKPLEMRDVIKTIADYDIHRMLSPPIGDERIGGGMILGATDSEDKTMDLNRMQNDKYMYQTILHEMRHVYNAERGFSQREDWVRDYACRDYKLFFQEKDCPNQNDLEKLLRSEFKN